MVSLDRSTEEDAVEEPTVPAVKEQEEPEGEAQKEAEGEEQGVEHPGEERVVEGNGGEPSMASWRTPMIEADANLVRASASIYSVLQCSMSALPQQCSSWSL